MSLFKRENRDAALGNLVDLLALREGGLYNYTGEKVNEMSALGISTVYSAISLNRRQYCITSNKNTTL